MFSISKKYVLQKEHIIKVNPPVCEDYDSSYDCVPFAVCVSGKMKFEEAKKILQNYLYISKVSEAPFETIETNFKASQLKHLTLLDGLMRCGFPYHNYSNVGEVFQKYEGIASVCPRDVASHISHAVWVEKGRIHDARSSLKTYWRRPMLFHAISTSGFLPGGLHYPNDVNSIYKYRVQFDYERASDYPLAGFNDVVTDMDMADVLHLALKGFDDLAERFIANQGFSDSLKSYETFISDELPMR